jgi:hypothetical protein
LAQKSYSRLKKQIYISDVKDGKLQKGITKAIKTELEKHEGKRVVITIERKRKTRSTMQNSYYWGVIVQSLRQCVLEEWGEDLGNEEAHEMLKFQCNYKELVDESTGEVIRMPLTTTNLTTTEMEEYNEKCRKFIFNFFNTVVPLPNEQGTIGFNQDVQ